MANLHIDSWAGRITVPVEILKTTKKRADVRLGGRDRQFTTGQPFAFLRAAFVACCGARAITGLSSGVPKSLSPRVEITCTGKLPILPGGAVWEQNQVGRGWIC